jgi:hypothetical protein
MTDEVFGQIITGDDVRNAVITTLRRWVPTYLAAMARRTGRSGKDLPEFKSFATIFDINKYAEDIIPACVIVAPGIIETPIREKGGYKARWGVGIGAVVAGQDRDNTYQLATLYTAVVRTICVQKQSLGGFADGIVWVSERYDNLNTDDLRTIAAGTIQLGVDVVGAVDPTAGPKVPAVDLDVPIGDWPTVEQVLIDVEQGV